MIFCVLYVFKCGTEINDYKYVKYVYVLTNVQGSKKVSIGNGPQKYWEGQVEGPVLNFENMGEGGHPSSYGPDVPAQHLE